MMGESRSIDEAIITTGYYIGFFGWDNERGIFKDGQLYCFWYIEGGMVKRKT
jgi:hypothetical protein